MEYQKNFPNNIDELKISSDIDKSHIRQKLKVNFNLI